MWVWALIGLWFVACLNPMPDDFPSQSETGDEETPGVGENDQPAEFPDNSASGGGFTDNPGAGGGAGNAGVPSVNDPGGAGAGGTGGSIEADAGAPEADAGP